MADIDIFASAVYHFDDMKSRLRLNHIGDLSGFQLKRCRFKFGIEFATSVITQFTAFVCRARVFGIEPCQSGKHIAVQHPLAECAQAFFNLNDLFQTHFWLFYNLLYDDFGVHHRDTVGGKFFKKSVYFGGCDGDAFGDFVTRHLCHVLFFDGFPQFFLDFVERFSVKLFQFFQRPDLGGKIT
jgi:hypothetical protein